MNIIMLQNGLILMDCLTLTKKKIEMLLQLKAIDGLIYSVNKLKNDVNRI